MGAGAGSIRGRVVLAGMALLWWLGSSYAVTTTTALPGQTVHRLYSNVQVSVPAVTATAEDESKHGNSSNNNTGLSAGRVAGIVVGCVGASVLLILLGLLLHCLCQRRKVSSNQEKPGSAFPPGEEFSDTSFVLPELGGPNPHNKFDGMEWVDIKGMDDDVLVDISSDLRKYQHQHQRP